MQIDKNRLEKHLIELAQIGKIGETGVCRLAHSTEDRLAVEKVREYMEEAGLKTRIDNFGNVIGRMDGVHNDLPAILVGSHIDSQPKGGRFDGTIGVLGAIEALHTLKERNIILHRSIEVISFADEEGCRFNKGLFGSRGICGLIEPGELERKDQHGITRRKALIDFGCNPDRLQDSVYRKDQIHCFLELHIEQGPVLDNTGQSVGIVTGIAGPLWLTVTLRGVSGHTGSVPMNMRQDALAGTGEIIFKFNNMLKNNSSNNTVGTVGSLVVSPNSRNTIPDEVEFTVDLRDIDLSNRNQLEKNLYEIIETTARKHGLQYEISVDTQSEPKYSADWIKTILTKEAEKLHLDAPHLMSGPFHDALAISDICDFGMIFVRCKEGISHNPKEYASIDDIADGVELLYKSIQVIAEIVENKDVSAS